MNLITLISFSCFANMNMMTFLPLLLLFQLYNGNGKAYLYKERCMILNLHKLLKSLDFYYIYDHASSIIFFIYYFFSRLSLLRISFLVFFFSLQSKNEQVYSITNIYQLCFYFNFQLNKRKHRENQRLSQPPVTLYFSCSQELRRKKKLIKIVFFFVRFLSI